MSPVRGIVLFFCLLLGHTSLIQAGEIGPDQPFKLGQPMPTGFALLKLTSTTRNGVPTSQYQVQFQKHNLGNIAIYVAFSLPTNAKPISGRMAYQYFLPDGTLYKDVRSQDGFSQIIDGLEVTPEQQLTKVLLKEEMPFFSLGYHRLELWWQRAGETVWHKAEAVIFEVLW